MVPGLTHHARARMQQRGIPESALGDEGEIRTVGHRVRRVRHA